MQVSTMRRKATYAMIAAGVGAGIATGYSHFDTRALGNAQAATAPSSIAAPAVAGTAAANLPDFTALVDRASPSVVNISVIGSAKRGMQGAPDDEDDDEAPAVPARVRNSRHAAWGRASSSARTATSSPTRTSSTAPAK